MDWDLRVARVMKRATQIVFSISLATAVVLNAAPTHAATITFQSIDLADVNVGEDLWMYEYVVSDIVFDANQGFSVYFDPSLYDGLQDPATQVSPDWDIITLQPDLGLPDSGIYDALALVAGASLGQAFTVTFNWLGGPADTPGAQDFTINQFGDDGSLSVLESGRTVLASVPEPSTLLLMIPAVAMALRQRSRRRTRVDYF
jgi:hypothetical protein